MSGLKVYYDLMSQPSRAVVLFLKRNKITFEAKAVALRKGEHFSPEFTAIAPQQKVPVIDDNGFILTESIAIMKYLAAKFNVADHWHPKDLRKQARVDEYLNWYHLNTRINAAFVFRTQVIDPRATGQPIDVAKLTKFRKGLNTSIEVMENVFLQDNQFLCGNEISIADLLAICEHMQPMACEEKIYEGHPKMAAWHERVKAKLQPDFDEVHSVLTSRVKDAIKSKL